MELAFYILGILIFYVLIILVREIYLYSQEVEIRWIKAYKYIFIIFMAVVANTIFERFLPNLMRSNSSHSVVIGIIIGSIINYFWPSKDK